MFLGSGQFMQEVFKGLDFVFLMIGVLAEATNDTSFIALLIEAYEISHFVVVLAFDMIEGYLAWKLRHDFCMIKDLIVLSLIIRQSQIITISRCY